MSYSHVIRRAGAPALLLALLALAAAPARAQAPADSRWLPWLGCWEATAPAGQKTVAAPAQLCIHSSPGAPGATFTTLVAGKTLGRHDVVADGNRHPVAEGGCHGFETATWSHDAHRVFRRTVLDCDGGGRRISTGVISFLPDDEWVEVDAAGTAGSRGVRVLRYRPMAPAAAAATGLMPQGEDLAIQTARAAAAAPLRALDVIEAADRIDPEALQALIYQRGNGYDIDAKTARELAAARVPADIIDLMVALSYPDYFDVNRGAAIALRNDNPPPSGRGGHGPGPWGGWGCYGYDSYAGYPGYYGYGYPGWIYSYPLGYGYYNPCWGGYGPYGGGLWGGGWGWYGPYGGVVGVGDGGTVGGTVVKGHGFSPPAGSSGSGRKASPRGGSKNPSGSVGKSGGGSASVSPAGRSGGSSGSTSKGSSGSTGGRTAKPRGH